MNGDILRMYERMAENGTAPDDGCLLFGVGYESAFERLERVYLSSRFERGDSAEKFVVGPFGSGKTHFMRQLMERARALGCVTSEVKLDKAMDYTDSLAVYCEVARNIRPPTGGRGVPALMHALADHVGRSAGDAAVKNMLVEAWAAGLESSNLELLAFATVAARAFYAISEGNQPSLRSATRWLGGEFSDRGLCKELGVAVVSSSGKSHHGKKALLSMFQLIRCAGLVGTVVCYDEAEQGLEANRTKTQRILSMFQSDINAIADLRDGSALVLYGITPDIFAKMEEFAALQQRIADPVPGVGFLEGDNYAPRIDLTSTDNPGSDLKAIGARLVDLFFTHADQPLKLELDEIQEAAASIADEVMVEDVRSGNRRALVKRVCSMLLALQDGAELRSPSVTVEAEV